MEKSNHVVQYPRRRLLRAVLRRVAQAAFAVLADLRVVGRENIPERGPLLVVANHFSYIDPVAMVRTARWPIEFIGGFRMPNAPAWTALIPKLWGYLPVFRGTGSRCGRQRRCCLREVFWGFSPKVVAGRRCCDPLALALLSWPLEPGPRSSPWVSTA